MISLFHAWLLLESSTGLRIISKLLFLNSNVIIIVSVKDLNYKGWERRDEYLITMSDVPDVICAKDRTLHDALLGLVYLKVL